MNDFTLFIQILYTVSSVIWQPAASWAGEQEVAMLQLQIKVLKISHLKRDFQHQIQYVSNFGITALKIHKFNLT